MAERAACSFVPRTPPKPGFSIRASAERRKQNQFVPRTPPKPGFSIRAFVERNKLKEKCAVCLETSSRTEFKTLGCNHRFHRNCLETMLKNGQRTCPLCRANINDSWLQEQQMVFVSDVVDELVDDMWVEFISDDDDEYYQYGSEYYGSEIYSSDNDDYNNIAMQIARQAEYEHVNAEHDSFDSLDLGLEQLFDESVHNNEQLVHDPHLERYSINININLYRAILEAINNISSSDTSSDTSSNTSSYTSSYTSSDTSDDIAEHRSIDVFELDDLGLDRLFDESIHRDREQSNDSIYRYFAWLDANDAYLDYW